MTKSLPIVLALVIVSFGCGDSPAEPSTRIISVSGDLAFGNVAINTTVSRVITISNTGNAALTVNSLSTDVPGGAFTANWLSGVIPAGASQPVTVFFRPTEARPYTGVINVDSNTTSGFTAIPVSGTGTP